MVIVQGGLQGEGGGRGGFRSLYFWMPRLVRLPTMVLAGVSGCSRQGFLSSVRVEGLSRTCWALTWWGLERLILDLIGANARSYGCVTQMWLSLTSRASAVGGSQRVWVARALLQQWRSTVCVHVRCIFLGFSRQNRKRIKYV